MKKILISIVIVFFANILVIAQTLPNIQWQTYDIKTTQKSAGFIDIADLNNDDTLEVILSTLMEDGPAACQFATKGAIRTFEMGSSGISDTWNENIVLPLSENRPFVNDPQVYDVNEDGHNDILVQQGFIRTNGGSHQWIEGPDFTQMHNFSDTHTAPGATYYFWHHSAQVDLDGDGKKDIITTSAQTVESDGTCLFNTIPSGQTALDVTRSKIEWYRHTGNGNFEYYEILDSLGGVFIEMHDIDGDQDMDIVVSNFFWGTSTAALVWLENKEAPAPSNNYKGVWEYHVIDNTTGLGYYFKFYDIDADDDLELVYCNHNNMNNSEVTYDGTTVVTPGLYWFEFPNDPKTSSQWEKHAIYEGFTVTLNDMGNPESQGTPGTFDIGDIDNNGYPDIAICGDGNDSLYMFRQRADHTFEMIQLDQGNMFGMTKIADLDNDGNLEVIAANHNYGVPVMGDGFLRVYVPTVVSQVNNLDTEQAAFVYPNPASRELFVDFKTNSEKALVEISSITGQIVKSKAYNNITAGSKKSINITNLEAGMYITTIYQNNIKTIQKIVKK